MSLVLEGMTLDDPLRAVVEKRLNAVLEHGRARPTSTHVTFADINGPRGGVDIRCAVTLEVPHQPTLHASALAADLRLALDGAMAALEHELVRQRQRRRTLARRPRKYFVAAQGLQADGEAALPPARRRRRSA
jgi:ribosome-associated translation inhibitor RaiA